MAIPLLTTKLFVPQARANLVARPHLFARLDEALSPACRLAVFSTTAEPVSGQVSRLEAQVEGWIAGPQMAALSMRGRRDRWRFLVARGNRREDQVSRLPGGRVE